jgi:hypothetical protein
MDRSLYSGSWEMTPEAGQGFIWGLALLNNEFRLCVCTPRLLAGCTTHAGLTTRRGGSWQDREALGVAGRSSSVALVSVGSIRRRRRQQGEEGGV